MGCQSSWDSNTYAFVVYPIDSNVGPDVEALCEYPVGEWLQDIRVRRRWLTVHTLGCSRPEDVPLCFGHSCRVDLEPVSAAPLLDSRSESIDRPVPRVNHSPPDRSGLTERIYQ